MERLNFYKYEGAGNDFIFFDNRSLSFPKENIELIKLLCHRRKGIGGDGLILLENDKDFDFRMVFYNPDGSSGAMCGNGGRCIVAFAKRIGVIEKHCTFRAADGTHTGEVLSNGEVALSLNDVKNISIHSDCYSMDTGCPHYVTFVDDLNYIDISQEGRKIRYDKSIAPNGTNVNFVKIGNKNLTVATYERGVEGETLSCGTGVTASAIAFALKNNARGNQRIAVNTKGGELTVEFQVLNNSIRGIKLIGGARCIFEGVFFI